MIRMPGLYAVGKQAWSNIRNRTADDLPVALIATDYRWPHFNMEKFSTVKKKICLLGSFAVGKTSLVERFVYNRFDDKYLTTIGVKISQKMLPPIQGPVAGTLVQYDLLIWDIAAMDKFDGMARNYYRGAAGAIAVADMTRPETITSLQQICRDFLTVSPGAQIAVLGNKLDIFNEDEKTTARLEAVSSNLSTKAIVTSAKTGERVEEAFLMLAGMIGSP